MGPMLLLIAACTGPDTTIRAGDPVIRLSTSAVDFGEVILGRQATVVLAIYNDGIGPLKVDDLALSGETSPDFSVLTGTPVEVPAGGYREIELRYLPDVVGQDFGALLISHDDPDQSETEVSLSAFGVLPTLDLDPEVVWFGHVPAGTERDRSVRLSAQGSGHLRVRSLELVGDGYALELPQGVSLPYEMATGLSFEISLTFTPQDEEPAEGALIIETNDPEQPSVEVALLGNTADDPTFNASPVVEITDPNWGESFLLGSALPVRAIVFDEEDPAESLYCYLLANNQPTGAGGSPDADGELLLEAEDLSKGDTTLKVRCLDVEGAVGEDEVEIRLFDPKEPLRYSLTGGPTLFDYWTVDDDVTVYVDGTAIFVDTSENQSTHPPLEFEARVGSMIRIVARDVNYCERLLDALTLHFGTGYSQKLNDDICQSACPEDACYDPSLTWTADVFFDETYAITIP